jgi:hypothetical protein
MRKYFALETARGVDSSSHVGGRIYYQRKIWFGLPDYDEKDHYRTVGSYNAFFYGKHRNNVTESRQFTGHAEIEEEQYNFPNQSEPVTVGTLYDFFDFIGFDNKTKRYLSGERILKWNVKLGKFV